MRAHETVVMVPGLISQCYGGSKSHERHNILLRTFLWQMDDQKLRSVKIGVCEACGNVFVRGAISRYSCSKKEFTSEGVGVMGTSPFLDVRGRLTRLGRQAVDAIRLHLKHRTEKAVA